MRNFRLLFMFMFLLLNLGLGARADNIIRVSSVQGVPGEEVMVSISLDNSDDISSMQVSIPLTDALSLVDGSGTLGSRCSSHSLTIGAKDGLLNVLVYSMGMSAITGNRGEVASFKLKLGSQPETINLTPSKIVLTNTDGQTISSSAESGSVTVLSAKAEYNRTEIDFGRVPIRSSYQKTITVTNVGNADLTINGLLFSDVNVFSSTTVFPKTISAGASGQLNINYSPVDRGSIEKTVKVDCNSSSKLNTIKLNAQPYAVNELHIQPASGIADEEVTVSMTMNNMDPISGFQIEFAMPKQLQFLEGSFAISNRKVDHVTSTSVNNGIVRIIVYSPSDKFLMGNDGEIGSFKVKLVGRNSVELTPTKTVLSATINNKVENVVSGVYGGLITISSPTISSDSTLDFGAIPVTEEAEKSLKVYNYGSTPLTINRVVFNNDNLSIKESLPITINSYESKALTVVYNSLEQTSFDAIMQIYSNDPEKRLHEVAVTGSRYAPNALTITALPCGTNDILEVVMHLDNYDAIGGLQFDMIYPNQYYSVPDNNVTLTTSANGMTVTQREIDQQTVRYFCYFLDGRSIPANAGVIMTINYAPKAEVPIGSYNVQLTNVKLGTGELSDKNSGTDQQISFTVEPTIVVKAVNVSREYGDANPTFNYTTEGGALAGTPEIICEATTTSPVGTYDIIINKGSITNNIVNFEKGTLTITPAPLTVKAGNYNKTQGDENPTFELIYEGFKNNETPDILIKQVTISCEATENSAPGEYPITLSGAEAQNYEISYVAGTLIISEAQSYMLTYLVDGDTYKNYSIKYHDAITPEPAPTKEGYTFSGWSEIPETMPAHDVTVTGTFSINQYTITYMIDEDVYTTDKVNYGSKITPPTPPGREGYDFAWGDYPETMPAYNITIYGTYATCIENIMAGKYGNVQFYTPDGKLLDKPQKGLNIVRMSDGIVKKVLVK